MLKATVVDAVNQARVALDDLLMDVTVTSRTPPTHVPGTVPVDVEVVSKKKMAIINYREQEIDGDRVRATDLKAIMFAEDGNVETNDVVSFDSKSFRILRNEPTVVGTTVLVNTLQLRPT